MRDVLNTDRCKNLETTPFLGDIKNNNNNNKNKTKTFFKDAAKRHQRLKTMGDKNYCNPHAFLP